MSTVATVRPKFELLLQEGLLRDIDLHRAVTEAQEQHVDIEQVLMRRYRVSKARLGASLERHYKCRYVPFDPRVPAPRLLLRNLKASYLRTELWVPLEARAGGVTVLIDDPNHLIKRDAVKAILPSAQIEYCVGLREDIEAFIDHFFGHQTPTGAHAAISGTHPAVAAPPVEAPGSGEVPRLELATAPLGAEEARGEDRDGAAAQQLLEEIVREAAARGASSIHIEPGPEAPAADAAVRLRVDGRCAPLRAVPAAQRQALVARVKALAGLDVAERRLPQEGKLQVAGPGGVPLDLQATTVPTVGGVEDVVLQLQRGAGPLPLSMLGLSVRDLPRLQRLLSARAGLLLCAGPAGAGKTTTLHAALSHLNRPELKIWTAEDPVEIVQPGLRQVQLRPKAGLALPAALSALLRADPDVLLIGDLREAEACALGLQAALSGRLVLGATRGAGAAEALGRLLELGLDPFNVADALVGVIAQRLARRLCEACREPYTASGAELLDLQADYGDGFAQLGAGSEPRLYRPRGCRTCQGTGYRGRVALFELLEMSEGLRRLILRRAGAAALRDQAECDGARGLKQDGIEKILLGVTDLREVRAACM